MTKLSALWMIVILKMLHLIIMYGRYGNRYVEDNAVDNLIREKDDLVEQLRDFRNEI